jgi:uncharacterized protein YcfL
MKKLFFLPLILIFLIFSGCSFDVNNGKNEQKLIEGNNYRIEYDSDTWNVPKNTNLSIYSDYSFVHKDKDVYAIILSERIEVPLDSLEEIVVENAQNVSDEPVEVVQSETVEVNGKTMKAIKINAKIQGVDFSYYNYVYGGKEGTVQLITYTSKNLFDQYEKDMKNLLDSLEIL